MSKSYKKHAVYKDKGNTSYNRSCRRVIKNSVKQIQNLKDKEEIDLPNPKILINDWDICDYKYYASYDPLKEKKKRKSAPKEYRK